jgi:N6-adenosine-specific RNA methylase IME4
MGPLARGEDMGPFDVLLSDCPWSYNDKARAGQRGVVHKYPLLTVDALCALDVQEICAPHANCFLWGTSPLLPEAMRVLAAWGFAYKRIAFVWRKVYAKSGQPFMGMGHSTRGNCEFVLEGVRGRGLKRVDAGIRQEVTCPVGDHSAKPHEVARRIQRLYGPQRRVELFAREKMDGWHGIGLDLVGDGRDIRAVLGSREPYQARPTDQALPVLGAHASA